MLRIVRILNIVSPLVFVALEVSGRGVVHLIQTGTLKTELAAVNSYVILAFYLLYLIALPGMNIFILQGAATTRVQVSQE